MQKDIYSIICNSAKRNKKIFSVLIDPDKFNMDVVYESNHAKVDFLLVGGSGVKQKCFLNCVKKVKSISKIPVVIFPGGREQISKAAEALLLLSLISGRNPDYLIGEHVRAAKPLKESKLEIIPTGYILINGGRKATAQKITHTKPIGHTDYSLVQSTAIAGELLGMRLLYLESGSGAKIPINKKMIQVIKQAISVPLLVGGGIDSPDKAIACSAAGADMIIVGNAIEKDISLISKISAAIYSLNR